MLSGTKTRVDHAFAARDAGAWQRYSAGPGAKGERYYGWAWIGLDGEWLLARRSISAPSEVACYRCWAPRPVGLPELVRVVGARWRMRVMACP